MHNENNNKLTKSTPNELRSKTRSWQRQWKLLAIAIYITFLILSSIPFMADNIIEPKLKESYEHHLLYSTDGRQSHYYVERVDKNLIGSIDLVYIPSTNSLSVSTTNIKVLDVYCRSLYEDECKRVFGFDPADSANYYKWYFIEKDHFTVNVDSDNLMTRLSFIDTPIPNEVFVNGLPWFEGREYNYTDSCKTVLSHVPRGNTHVDIYFKSADKNRPTAIIKVDRSIVNINTPLFFDGTGSFDVDGEIISYIWDFGDGNNSGGKVNSHTYSEPGYYTIILTVRDDDFMVDHAYFNLTVVKGSTKPAIKQTIPNQIREEDSPPWELNLKSYGMDFDGLVSDLRWYITGEDSDLYNIVGENSSDQKLIFSLLPNAFGNDHVTIYLVDKDGFQTNQQLWVNITPVNDKPVIKKFPHLIIHYEVPYTFYIRDYIYDIETPFEELEITVSDQFGSEHLTLSDDEIVLEYPKEYMVNSKSFIITVTVSDGDSSTNGGIPVTIGEHWPPILTDGLPDIMLEEREAIYGAFKLNDYFTSPDQDELYYTYSESNVRITINDDSSVDFVSVGQWIGTEQVIFRAQDSKGAIVEDSIQITVVPINDPPKIGNVPDLKVHYDKEYYFDLSYYISDSDNELYELTLSTSEDLDSIWISGENNLGLILKYPKSMLGITIKVIITVSDGIFNVNKAIQVTVISDYPPELIKRLPDVSFNEDEELNSAFNLDDHFLDLDNDTLYYTTGNKMILVTIDPSHGVNFDSLPNWFGTEKVIFRATDPSGAIVEDSIMVTVVPINDPPSFKSLPKLLINESETFEFDLSPYVYDIDDNISNLIISVDDQNVFVSGNCLVIFGSKSLPRELDVMVSDGVYTVTRTLEIKVIAQDSRKDDSIDEIIRVFGIILAIIILVIIILALYFNYRMQRYDVQEIFLIHNSGKLLNHIYCKTHSKFDDEIFSGMFTAIQEFIEDSFTSGNPDSSGPVSVRTLKAKTIKSEKEKLDKKPLKLNEFKVGDNQVIIEHGKFIFMAVVYDGPGARALHKIIQKSITEIEFDYGEKLEYWDGDIKQIKGIKEYLEELLPEQKLLNNDIYNDLIKFNKFQRVKSKNKIKKISSSSRRLRTSKSITKSIPLNDLQKRLI